MEDSSSRVGITREVGWVKEKKANEEKKRKKEGRRENRDARTGREKDDRGGGERAKQHPSSLTNRTAETTPLFDSGFRDSLTFFVGPNLFEGSSSSVSLPRPRSVSAMRMMPDSKDTTNEDFLGPTLPTL
ncbi:hypothetical protein V1478_012719 [Vespula squamosa]|uniref:Uncharacterized protein n=1 Tax=Vespula squamosa TaxID=30214 RepID=A0ABD2A8S7_VESSQ